jgi:thiol-disulfide isomerase/thioredoxin
VFLLVIIEYDPTCPVCEYTVPLVEEVCKELEVPYSTRVMATHTALDTELNTSHYYMTSEFLSRAKPELLQNPKVQRLVSYIDNGAQAFPVVIIQWHYGPGDDLKEIIIQGGPSPVPEEKERYRENLKRLLEAIINE